MNEPPKTEHSENNFVFHMSPTTVFMTSSMCLIILSTIVEHCSLVTLVRTARTFTRSSWRLLGRGVKQLSISNPHKYASHSERSGLHVGYGKSECLEVSWLGNISCNRHMFSWSMWAVSPSCWNTCFSVSTLLSQQNVSKSPWKCSLICCLYTCAFTFVLFFFFAVVIFN